MDLKFFGHGILLRVCDDSGVWYKKKSLAAGWQRLTMLRLSPGIYITERMRRGGFRTLEILVRGLESAIGRRNWKINTTCRFWAYWWCL